MGTNTSSRDKEQVLPRNVLHDFNTYSTYFTVKLGRAYRAPNNPENPLPIGHSDPENILLLDTRGQDLNSSGQAQRPNPHPKLSVRHFDVMHFFNHGAEAHFGLDSTLRIFERGSASYIQDIGATMLDLGIASVAELVLWVGVGMTGWIDGNPGSDGGWTAVPVSQHWFPFHIHKIDVNIRSSGAEYTHWLKGWTHHRATDMNSQQINNVITRGLTFGDHLTDLMKKASKASSIAKRQQEENFKSNPENQPKEALKTILYEFELVESFPSGLKFSKDARVDSDTTTMNTGGVIDIHSGGESGETTMNNHIHEILTHCPSILKTLDKQNHWYKIITRSEMTEESETITFEIFPYQLDSKGLLPLKRFTYFFGGRNEDVLEFNFNMDGLFRLLPQVIVDSTRNAKEKDTSRNESADGAKTTNQGAVGQAVVVPDAGRGNTSNDKVTPANRRGRKSTGGFPPIKSKANSFYKNNLRETQRLNLNLTEQVESFVGNKLLEGGFKIIGDPNLILDEVTIQALKNGDPPAPLERAVNYVTFDIGTPNPDFPNNLEVENFIFNGYYGIRNLKSIWDERGTFTQEIDVYWRAELSPLSQVPEDRPPDEFGRVRKR